jgi:hypothetical protein
MPARTVSAFDRIAARAEVRERKFQWTVWADGPLVFIVVVPSALNALTVHDY